MALDRESILIRSHLLHKSTLVVLNMTAVRVRFVLCSKWCYLISTIKIHLKTKLVEVEIAQIVSAEEFRPSDLEIDSFFIP